MNRPTFADHTGCSRTFVSCLMISLIILSPLAPLASATPSFFKRGEALHVIDPAALLVPNITASKTDTFSDPNADGKAEPGDTITYDVNVTNSGTDATNVNFADTIDANTTLVPGSLKVSPLAFDDTYVAAKDSPLSVGAPGVLTNDTGIPAPTAVTIAGGATTQGGTVTLNADGSFLYNPPAGFEGSDTFTYTATNGLAPNDTTTVTITVDAAPTVASTTPTNGATNQALNTNITVTFSEPVNVTGNWFQISCPTSGTRNVADTVVTGGSTTFTINPNTDFSPNETCTVTVSAAQVSDQDSADPPDNMTANFVFSFTTIDVAPTVTTTTPTNGGVNQTTNTDISVTFSEPVNVGPTWFQIVCGTSGTRNVVDTVVTGGPTTFTINPNADFAAGETCTVTISATQVTDQDTNDPPDNMAANFVFSFTMDAAPTVNATTPTNGATQVANNTNVTITFSEPVDVTGNWFQIVGATSGTRNVADTAVTGGPTTFTINPNVDFTNGEVVTVTVFAAQVSDQDSADPPQNMAANFVFSFTIDLPPSVTSTVPTNGAIDVLKGSNIVVNFSENVNATTSSFTISCPAPGNLQAFAVSGSGTNAITLNPTADLPPGVICTVTVIANQISDTDAGDPPDNMVADFVFSFGVKPEATDDARNATGNIQIQTAGRSNFTVLSNDIGPGIMVTAFDATSLRGGNVAIAASGTLTYNPPAGYEGLDSFNYTISNPAGSDVGTVVITVTGMIWFVNNSASSCATINGACGRLTNPFSTLAAFETANGNASPVVNGDVTSPEAGDHLFVYTGAGSYNSSLTLENTQRVIGQGSTSSLQTLSGVTPAIDSDALPATGGTNPIITNSGGGGIAVAQNNRIHGLTIQNTTGTGLSGNAFGTLTVSENVIVSNTTTAGTAVNLTNGTLAATFRSISAGNNDGNPDPANGIVLTTTSGTFTVDGDGANTAVGGNASGGTIQNTVGADGATGGNGVFLSGAAGVTLRRMTISGTNQNNGIRLINSSNFTLEFSRVTGSNGNSGAQDESSLHFDNLTGTAAITSCVIEGGFEDNLNVVNTSGTLNRLTISGTTFGFNSAAGGNNSITFDAQNAGTTLNFTLKSSLIKGSHIDWLNAGANSGSTMDAVIGGPLVADGNSFDNTGANAFVGPIPNGNRLVTGSIGNMTLDIRNNTLKGSLGEAIRVRSSAAGALTGTMNARVRNNTIGVAATANSGSTAGSGIFVLGDGGSDMNIAVTNNSVFQYNQSGIMLQFGDEINDGAVYNATVTGNTVNTPGTLLTNFNAIQLNNGTIMATDNFTTCADIGGAGVGNNVAGGGKGAAPPNNVDIRLRQRQTTTVRLPGYVGPVRDNSDSDVAEVAAYLAGRNTLTTAAGNSVPTGGGFIGGAACTAPSFAGPITLSFNKRNATFEKLPMEDRTSDNQPENILWATKRQNDNEKMTMEVPASHEQPENILWATKGQNDNEQHVVKLTQSEVSAMVHAAIARWAEAGISAKNLDKLQALTFEIVDLPAGQLASASSSRITLDETAAGYGWFFDPTPSDDNEFEVSVPNQELQTTELSAAHGRVDLLTVLMRQLGSGLSGAKSALKAPQAWLMEGTLGTGTRRAPAFTVRKMGKTLLVPGATVKQVRATTAMKSAKTPMPADARVKRTASPASESRSLTLHAGIDARTQPQAIRSRASANDKPKLVNRRRSASQTFSHHARSKPKAALTAKALRIAPASILSGETVSHSIGTLKSGKTVHIQFQVTVDTPFLGSSSEVANQGTVTFDGGGPVLTDDPSVGGANDPTVTPVAVPPNLFVRDASVAEPASGSTSMIFTLALSAPAPMGGITANVSTADGTATGGTCAGGNDYESVSGGLVTFNAGDQIKTFPVTVCSDAAAEGDETFTLNVNSAPGAVITDGTGTGTITANVPGTIIISELRTSGPGGAGDDFVEIYNNTDASHTVPAGGYGLFKRGASCDALPVLIGTIPAGTIIPQRGHYLFTGSAYSLANYGGTGAAAGDQALAADLESDFNVGLFSTTDPLAISTANRLDAVGFGVSTGGICDVVREGTTLQPASGSTSEHSFVREFTLVSNNVPTPTDANDNATDFTVVSTTPSTPVGANAATLGAPGPENLTSPPLKKFTQVGAFFLDQTKAPSAEPNRHRDLTVVPNGALGTLSSRRRFVNNTGGAITRLRFRIYDITTFPVPTGTADLRALTSVSVSVGGVADPVTCAAAGTTPPCTVTVLGTTLEEPPAQSNGGGLNSTMSAGTVTLGTPIANGASINLQFLFGIQQSGSFRVFVFVEALP